MKNYKLITFTLVLATLISCSNKSETVEPTQKVETAPSIQEVMLTAKQFDALQMKKGVLTERNMTGYAEANGKLEVPPQNEASITSLVGANIVSINVIEGDKVAKGQVVSYLSHPNIIKVQTDYLNAYNNRNLAQKNFERVQKLYKAGVESGANFQKAESAYIISKTLVLGLESELKLLNINPKKVEKGSIYQKIGLKSPIEGFVEKVLIKTGQYVQPQTSLFEIVNTHHVHADLMVFEKDVHKVKKGQTVKFSVQSSPGEELSAVIYSVGKTFEESPKAVHVHAEIENKKGNLIPGMYLEGRIEVEDTKTLAVPEGAVVKDGDKFYIFSVEKENSDWSLKPIEVIKGIEDNSWVAIRFLSEISPTIEIAQNNAYYLMAEMKKGSAGHSH